MKRRLLLAISVYFAVLTVAICVLWVRSYWWTDSVGIGYWGHKAIWARSLDGQVIFGRPWTPKPNFSVQTEPAEEWRNIPPRPSILGFRWGKSSGLSPCPVVPHWFFILVSGVITFIALLYRKPRALQFSLRSMLLIVTLIAAVLGIISFSVR